MTTLAFTAYAFKASGASVTTARTQPDRLADIKNVKDFGAKADGSDDTSAIQAAINWTSGANRGTIFFPAGVYNTTAPLTFNYDPAPGAPGLSIRFLGEGESTQVGGNSGSAGYVFDRHLATPNNTAHVIIENFAIVAGTGFSGIIRLGSCDSAVIRNVHGPGITTEDSPGNSSHGVIIQSCTVPGVGIVMGGSGVIQSCNLTSCDVGYRMYGNGWVIEGCRIEESNTSYLIGLDTGVAATFTGSITSTGTDDGSTVLTVASGLTGTLKPLQAVQGAGIPGAIFIVSQLSGTTGGVGTYALSNCHQTLVVGLQTITTIGRDAGASGFAIQGGTTEGCINGIMLAGTCNGFYLGSVNDIAHGSSGTGGGGSGFPTQYHMIVGPNCSNGVFQSLGGAGDLSMVAACKVYTAAARTNVVFMSCLFDRNAGSGGTGVNWDYPSNAYTMTQLKCNESKAWIYSQLPTGTNVLEGDQFTITDSTTTTWGANVTTGGGSSRVLVRWNNANWTVVGK